MDDIFSAVDARVGRHLLEHCIDGALCRGRTVIIATHHVGICESKARLIVELVDGAAKTVAPSPGATYDDSDPLPPGIKTRGVGLDGHSSLPLDGSTNGEAARSHSRPNIQPTDTTLASDLAGRPKARRQFIHAEARPEGAVKRSVYRSYLTAVGNHWHAWWGLVLFSCVALQFVIMGRCLFFIGALPVFAAMACLRGLGY